MQHKLILILVLAIISTVSFAGSGKDKGKEEMASSNIVSDNNQASIISFSQSSQQSNANIEESCGETPAEPEITIVEETRVEEAQAEVIVVTADIQPAQPEEAELIIVEEQSVCEESTPETIIVTRDVQPEQPSFLIQEDEEEGGHETPEVTIVIVRAEESAPEEAVCAENEPETIIVTADVQPELPELPVEENTIVVVQQEEEECAEESTIIVVQEEEDCAEETQATTVIVADVQPEEPELSVEENTIVVVQEEEDCAEETAIIVVQEEEDCAEQPQAPTVVVADVEPEVPLLPEQEIEIVITPQEENCNVDVDIALNLDAKCYDQNGEISYCDNQEIHYKLSGVVEIELIRDGKTIKISKNVASSG